MIVMMRAITPSVNPSSLPLVILARLLSTNTTAS
jgi:hypothetical protein